MPTRLPIRFSLLLAGAALATAAAACEDHDARPELDAPAAPADPVPQVPGRTPPTTPSGDPALAGRLPAGITEQMVQDGQGLFAGRAGCFTCHGRAAEGAALGPALNDREWIHLESGRLDEILGIIRAGVPQPVEYPGPMPPMGGVQLTDREIDALAAYVFAVSRGV